MQKYHQTSSGMFETNDQRVKEKQKKKPMEKEIQWTSRLSSLTWGLCDGVLFWEQIQIKLKLNKNGQNMTNAIYLIFFYFF